MYSNNELLGITKILIEVIENPLTEIIEYGEVSRKLRTQYGIHVPTDEISYRLDEINKLAHKVGLPHISIIVVQKGKGTPGTGFFRLMRKINPAYSKDIDDMYIWKQEYKSTYECKDWTALLIQLGENTLTHTVSNEAIVSPTSTTITHTNDNITEVIKVRDSTIYEDIVFVEGAEILKTTKVKIRNPIAPQKAKELFKAKNDGQLFCEICGFDFDKFYGELGKGYMEAHHREYLSNGERKTTLKDFALVCSNCHSILHRTNLSVEKLKELVEERRGLN